MITAGRAWSGSFAALFALSFVGFPLVSSFGSAFDVYSRELSIMLRAVIMLLSIGCLAAGVLRVPARRWADPALWAMFIFWMVLLVRFAWDAGIVPIPLDIPWYDLLTIVLGITMIPALALVHAPDEKCLSLARVGIVAMASAAGCLVIYAFVSAFLGSDVIVKLLRLSTKVLNPISVGQLGVILVIAGVLAPAEKGADRLWRIVDSRYVRAFAGLLGAVLVAGSASKGPMLALLAACLAWLAGRVLRGETGVSIVKGSLAVFFAIVGLGAIALTIDSVLGLGILDRIGATGRDYSTVDRITFLGGALQQFEQSPLLGDAFVESMSRTYPHNLLVDTLMVSGVVGFALLSILLSYCAAAALRVLRSRQSWIALLYVQFLVSSMLSGSVYLDPFFWGATAVLLAVDRMLFPVATRDALADAPPLELARN